METAELSRLPTLSATLCANCGNPLTHDEKLIIERARHAHLGSGYSLDAHHRNGKHVPVLAHCFECWPTRGAP